MPKLKAHKGTTKRIKLSAGGKVIRRRANGGHFLTKKSNARKRVITTDTHVAGTIGKNIKRALGV